MSNYSNTQQAILPQLMQRHVAELNALWCRRRLVMTSAEHTLHDLHKIDFRIRAHTEALLAGSLHSHALLLEQETDNDRDAEFAVSYPLLETGADLVRKTLCQRFATTQPPVMQGLRDAWMHSSLGNSAPRIRQILHEGNAENAACSAEVLAMHGLLTQDDVAPINELIRHTNGFVRACAWRLPRYLRQTDGVVENLLFEQNFQLGIKDDNPEVRTAAGWTAAWCASFKDPLHLINALKRDVELLPLWVALADHTCRDDIEAALASLNPVERAHLIGAYGNSGLVPMLLDDMQSSDVPGCYAAGQAYSRITGADITSTHNALLHSAPDSVDEFDKEFLPTIYLPDADQANTHWQKHKKRFSAHARWHRGHDISRNQSSEALAAMDMQARWSMLARQRVEKNCDSEMAQVIRIRRSSPGAN